MKFTEDDYDILHRAVYLYYSLLCKEMEGIRISLQIDQLVKIKLLRDKLDKKMNIPLRDED